MPFDDHISDARLSPLIGEPTGYRLVNKTENHDAEPLSDLIGIALKKGV